MRYSHFPSKLIIIINIILDYVWSTKYSWDQKKVVYRKSRLIPRKIKEIIHSLKNPNHLSKISYMLPEIWLPNLRYCLVTFLFHIRRFELMKVMETRHFCSVNLYCIITLICLVTLVSHIAQLFLVHKFYCFYPGLHITFKYVRHNHLHCLMMREVSLKT